MEPKDLKPKPFVSTAAFLERAKQIIGLDRAAWSRGRQMAHDVTKAEAEQIVYWASVDDVREHWTKPGHYLVWGFDRRNRLVRVWATIGDGPDGGEYLGLEAFEEDKPFGS